MPEEVVKRTYEANQVFYDQIQADNPQGERVGIGASIVLISGCQDNQVSLDGAKNGVFTGALLKVWDNGKFSGGLPQFHKDNPVAHRRLPKPELHEARPGQQHV